MHEHAHGHGLAEDLDRLVALQRRTALRWLGAGAITALAGCGGGGGSSGEAFSSSTGSVVGSSTTTTTGSASSTTCSTIPSETAGPYPGDGTNSGGNGGVANALTQSGIVRSNIVSSFGTSSGSADGVALTVTLKLVSAAGSCTPLAATRCTSGTATSWGATRCTRRRWPARTTCAACR